MKAIIYETKQDVCRTAKIELTEELYNKILEELQVEPKVPFDDFYEFAIGNEHFAPYVDYNYLLKEGHYWHHVDYYDNEESSGYTEAGTYRHHESLDIAIRHYFEIHPEQLENLEEKVIQNYRPSISVPDRKIRYE